VLFSFIHAADIHLDSPLDGLSKSSLLEEDIQAIRGATRRALDNLVQLAIQEKVAFLLIAGDVYDGDWKDHRTGLYFIKQMARLHDAGIRVYLIRGNHDAQNKMTTELRLPPNVHMFDTVAASSVAVPGLDLMIHGQGFATAKVVDDLSIRYPLASNGCLNIGLLHTSATGREGHERYAPCSLDSLKSKGYDYWALGHIHKREVLSSEDSWIAFSGNLQGRHVRETGPKGCYLVKVDGRNTIRTPEFRSLDVLRWEVFQIDATDAKDRDELLDRFAAGIPAFLREASDLRVMARVEITGQSSIHHHLVAQQLTLESDLRSVASTHGLERLWIEKVKLQTRPETHEKSGPISDQALAVIEEIMNEFRGNPKLITDLANSELSEMFKKLGSDISGFEDVRPDNVDWLRGVFESAESLLQEQLAKGGND
jgi:DNA repair exonuclease SbcCD nuclease subunit